MDAPDRRARSGPACPTRTVDMGALVGALLGGLLTLVALVLVLAPSASEPTAVPLVLGVLALAVVARVALRVPLLLVRPGGALPPASCAARPARRPLVLDVEHHPRRPRAPGAC